MAENNSKVVEKKESKAKKFLTSKALKAGVQVMTTVLTLANTVFLIWTCATATENEVNAEVMDEYWRMKESEVKPDTSKGIVEVAA